MVRFRAGSFKTAAENLNLDAYRKKPNRRLVVMSERPDIGNRTLIDSLVKKVDHELRAIDDTLGIICINGNSAGGRSALEFAAALRDKHPVKFLGIADAALFGNLPGMNRPIIINPLIRIALNNPNWTMPFKIRAEITHNFFQTVENEVGGNPIKGFVWTSSPIGEVHGKLEGFQLNEKISVPFGKRAVAHDFAGDEGDRRNGATISNLLAAL